MSEELTPPIGSEADLGASTDGGNLDGDNNLHEGPVLPQITDGSIPTNELTDASQSAEKSPRAKIDAEIDVLEGDFSKVETDLNHDVVSNWTLQRVKDSGALPALEPRFQRLRVMINAARSENEVTVAERLKLLDRVADIETRTRKLEQMVEEKLNPTASAGNLKSDANEPYVDEFGQVYREPPRFNDSVSEPDEGTADVSDAGTKFEGDNQKKDSERSIREAKQATDTLISDLKVKPKEQKFEDIDRLKKVFVNYFAVLSLSEQVSQEDETQLQNLYKAFGQAKIDMASLDLPNHLKPVSTAYTELVDATKQRVGTSEEAELKAKHCAEKSDALMRITLSTLKEMSTVLKEKKLTQ